ncbi:MAG: hypothetical protein WCK59_02625 [Candidatus Falkowbacteria bacterium]
MKNIKKSQIALGLMALTIVSVIGFSSATLASGTENSDKTATSTTTHLLRHNKNSNKATSTQIATMKAKQAAIKAALAANDYNAWVSAVGTNAPILKKINANNFSQYVQAYNLNLQAQTIMTQLGISGGMGMGMGERFGMNGLK